MIEMKDSGVDWIGEIPAHWEIKRLKDVATSGSGTTPKSSNEKYYENGIYPWLITGDVQNKEIVSNDIFITELAVSEVPNLKLFPSKTVLLAMYGGGTIGNVGLMTYPAYINQACCALIPLKIIAEKYLFYYLLNKQERIISTGIGGTQINLSQNKIVAYPIAVPPIEEQRAIADYLDEKTAEIDKQVELLEQKQKAYQKLKTSLISQLVTRGLNKDVPLKDSGIDWIGEIPAHWEVKRIKAIFTECKELSTTGTEDLLSVSEYYGVARRLDVKEDDEYDTRADSLEGYKICKKNDLVINIMLAWKRGLGFSDFDGIVSPAYAVYRGKGIIPHYYHYLLRTDRYIAEFKRNSKGIIDSRLRLYSDRFFAVKTIVPPIEEQQAIADYLDEKTAEIDEQISNIDKKINTYKRLKQSLIDEVVTGKRKI